MTICKGRHIFIASLGREAPFSWLVERGWPGCAILLSQFGRRLVEFFLFRSKTVLAVGSGPMLYPGGLVA